MSPSSLVNCLTSILSYLQDERVDNFLVSLKEKKTGGLSFQELRKLKNIVENHFYTIEKRLGNKADENDLAFSLIRYHRGIYSKDPLFNLKAIKGLPPTLRGTLEDLASASKEILKKKLPPFPALSGISVYNVGQGNFVVGNGKDGQNVIFDCGFDLKEGSEVIYNDAYSAINKMGSNNTIVLSHYDLDHFLACCFNLHDPLENRLLSSQWIIPDHSLYFSKKTKKCLLSFSALQLLSFLFGLHSNNTYILDHAAGIKIVGNSAVMTYGSGGEKNNQSIICKVVVNGALCLMPGDATYQYWPRSLKIGGGAGEKKIDFFVVPHHGCLISDPFPSRWFAKGATCFLCTGVNDYGHPNFSHLRHLNKAGIVIHRFANDPAKISDYQHAYIYKGKKKRKTCNEKYSAVVDSFLFSFPKV